MKCSIDITDRGDPLSTLIIGVKVAKTLNLDSLHVNFIDAKGKPFSISVKPDSNTNDLWEIHKLKMELSKLAKK